MRLSSSRVGTNQRATSPMYVYVPASATKQVPLGRRREVRNADRFRPEVLRPGTSGLQVKIYLGSLPAGSLCPVARSTVFGLR